MSEWTREQRYQGIDDVPQSQLIELKQKLMLHIIDKRIIFNLKQDF